MTTKQQLKAELKDRFNPEQGEGLKTVDSDTIDIFWNLFQIDHPHIKNIQRSVWEEALLESLAIMGIFKD